MPFYLFLIMLQIPAALFAVWCIYKNDELVKFEDEIIEKIKSWRIK